MKVFKFGGASVKDANAVKNISKILNKYKGKELVIVISAMGKTTNALEEVLDTYFNRDDRYLSLINQIKQFHLNILNELFADDKNNDVFDEIDDLFLDLECFLEKEFIDNYDYVYDQIVSYGELLSTKIVHAYLTKAGIKCRWIDARNFIITKKMHREAKIEWKITENLIQKKLLPIIKKQPIITQGFIGSTQDKITTTLGREGSDFTASIFANALDAEEVILWKDVPGVLNADPARFTDTVKFDSLSYHDAIEMTYYGASVLHPKTIKPLQNKNIPLYVKSFVSPDEVGTLIHSGISTDNFLPTIIVMENQILFSISTRDYSFIAEENLSKIFFELAKNRIRANVMQNSAISFSFCTNFQKNKIENFMAALESEYILNVKDQLSLITIRQFNEKIIEKIIGNKTLHLEQRNGNTIQFVVN